MHRYFYLLYLYFREYKLLAWTFSILILVISACFALQLKFEEDITRIIPKNEKTTVTSKILEQLNFSDKINVIITRDAAGTVDDMVDMATLLIDSLQPLQPYYKTIQGQIDDKTMEETMAFIYQQLPIFLTEQDYKNIQEKLTTDSIKEIVSNNYKSLISPTGLITKRFIQQDPLGIGFLALKRFQKLNVSDDFQLYNGFIITKDSSKLLLFINPTYAGAETEHNTAFINALNRIKEPINTTFSTRANLVYFGPSFVAVANAKQIKTDIQTTVLISMTLLMVILIIFYRKLLIPVIIFIPTIFAALIALAFLYFLRGTISAISISIAAVLIGITIDYALHIMTHYRHTADIKSLYKEISKPVMMSAGTTAVAFLCLLFVNSESLKDLGIFAFIAVLLSGVFSLILIPHLYKPSTQSLLENKGLVTRISHVKFDKNRLLQGFTLLLIVVSIITFHRVGFNKDLSALNYFPKELKEAEQQLEGSTDQSSKSLYLVSYGTNSNDVMQENSKLLQQLDKDSSLLSVNSIGEILLSKEDQQRKIQAWNHFWDTNKKAKLTHDLIQEGNSLGFKANAYEPFFDLLQQQFNTITLAEYQHLNPGIFSEYVTEKNGFYSISTIIKIAENKRDQFVTSVKNPDKYLVIDRKEMNETFLGELVKDFNNLINYSFIAIFIILWMSFRRIELVLVSMIPIVLTGFVTAGLMGLFKIEFNIFSTIVCTLVFGHGVDFTIFMTAALQKEYSTGRDEMPAYRTSILLAVLTTILAIGALIFAQHPALRSISTVSLIGVVAAVLITFVLYPVIFRFCFNRRIAAGKSPISLRLLLHSSLSFTYYALGCILLSVVVRFTNNRFWMTRCMSKFMNSVLKTNPFVRKRVENPYAEDFQKPAIIIANHNSFLDTLLVGGIHDKCIFIVNEWVNQSPIFGKAIQRAGFYPISQGLEGAIDTLRSRIAEGFSIVIFPEGSRSPNNVIQRFHKGAFYLSEQLELDIVPVFLHGNADITPKGDYIIYDGSLSTVIGKRISFSEHSRHIGYAKQTKAISIQMKATYATIRKRLEDPYYFQEKLNLNYRYKENAISKAVQTDFKDHASSFAAWNLFIPEDAKILHVAVDYGQIDFLLVMQQAQRKIQTWIDDTEKRAIASSTYLLTIRQLTYIEMLTASRPDIAVLLIGSLAPQIEIQHTVFSIICYGEAKSRTFPSFEPIWTDNYSTILKRISNEV